MATVTIATRSLKKGKTYVVNYKDPETGRKKYHKSFRRKDLAQEEANRLRTLLDSGKPLRKEKGRTRTASTFGHAASICKEEWLRKLKEEAISESTYKGYQTFLKPVLAEWEHVLLEELDADTIRDYRVQVAESGSNVLGNRRLFVIKQVFATAQRRKLIEHDVAAGIKYLSEKASERKTAQKPIEIDALLEAASKRRSRHYLPLAILLAVEHGCSMQEVRDLEWSQVDLDENQITFHHTKNGVTRTHKIMPRTRQALLDRKVYLETYRRKRGVEVKGEYVVGHPDGTLRNFRKAWEGLCKDHDFDDLHFHDHRHTYCTNLLLSGSTLKEASVMIGHRDLRMTNRYSNLEDVIGTSAQDRLAARYAKASNDE